MSLVNIGTFNVNSVKSRLPILEHYLKGTRAPDILCLQEIKCQDGDFPADFFAGLGYGCVYKGMKAYNGVAILSKKAPDVVQFGLGDGQAAQDKEESENARVVTARFGDLHIVNTYIPQGKEIDNPDFAYKLRFFERVKELFMRKFNPADKVLWVGDLNAAPTDLDVTNPKTKKNHVCFTQAVRDTFADVVGWGFTDIFRKYKQGAGEFSFWDYRVKDSFERNIGWRIDHILGTASLAEQSRDAWVERELRAMERPSDHTAVVAAFKD